MNTLTSSNGQAVLDFISEKFMEAQNQVNAVSYPTNRKLSQQMRAVLIIFNADVYLMEAVAPFINVDTETINWQHILRLPLCSGHKAAILWAYGVWTDDQPERGECFDGALNMSPALKIAVLEALCLRWGFRG